MFDHFLNKLRWDFSRKEYGVEVNVVKYNYEGEPIVGEQLKKLLDEKISPRLLELGIKWRGDYYWVGESVNGIRNIVHYDKITKGGYRGVITWGVAFDFLCIPSGNKLVYHRTEKSARLHLFEWPKGYSDTFLGKEMNDGIGITSHFSQVIDATINQVMNAELPNMMSFFDRASTIEGAIEIAEGQFNHNDSFGSIHFPTPAYVLAFLYGKCGRTTEAMNMLVLNEFKEEKDYQILQMVKEKIVKLNNLRHP